MRGGIPRPTGNFPESLSQQILVGIILVERLGVLAAETSNNEKELFDFLSKTKEKTKIIIV